MMNSIYNEIYGLYYYMLEQILDKAASGEITAREISSIVSQHGFSESGLYFTPEIVAQNGEGYNLLKLNGTGYSSILKSSPQKPLTTMQKGFIKSMLADQKIRLFFEDHTLAELESALSDIDPLFELTDVAFIDTALDSDNYADEKYIQNFREILKATRQNKAMRICFNSSKGERMTIKLAPYKLEYGIRDDKFRLCGVSIYKETLRHYIKINLARVLSVSVLEQSFECDFEAYIAAKRKPQPIEIEVYNLRNGFERVFIGLSNFERISSFCEESEKCRIKIYYTDDEEQELLIQLLSYGPAVKVLGPAEFKSKFVQRIKKQYEMINKP